MEATGRRRKSNLRAINAVGVDQSETFFIMAFLCLVEAGPKGVSFVIS